MTDTKTPKPGEWWLSGSSLIAYVVGFTIDGDPAWQQKGRRQVLSDEIGFFLACFHHEPRCDSFDWVEPEPEPEQAEWSDMAAIQNLDLRRAEMAGRISWAENQAIIQVIAIAKRAIQPVETWPKWYVGEKWSDGNAYVRVDDTEAEFIWVSADGSERVYSGNRYAIIPLCVSEHSWREVTKAEALARVKPHPTMDCPICGEFRGHGHQCKPVESPDDWVEITDGDHVIRAIDQVNARGNGDGGWYGAFSSIGSKVKHNEYLIVRCRRKDLPVQKRCTCPTLDGIPVTGSACPIHGLPDDSWREVTEAEALARIKPVAIDPGDGWEILPDETMREINDELTDDGGANWQKTNSSGTPIPHDSPYVYRRRIQPMHTTIDVNPGDGYRWLGPEEFVEGTDEVFRPDLNPMWIPPLTRAGYMCCDDDYPVRRRIEPVESPDDWVEITDPKYVLRQGDQFTHCMNESDRIVKRIPVDLIAMRDNRVIWRPHGQTLLKDEQFILHDADGFYVEGER